MDEFEEVAVDCYLSYLVRMYSSCSFLDICNFKL
jgi:hypothetical protein